MKMKICAKNIILLEWKVKLAIIGVGVSMWSKPIRKFLRWDLRNRKDKIVRDLSDLLNELREFSSTRAHDWARWVGEMYHFAFINWTHYCSMILFKGESI